MGWKPEVGSRCYWIDCFPSCLSSGRILTRGTIINSTACKLLRTSPCHSPWSTPRPPFLRDRLSPDSSLVERKLIAFENVTITTTTLARTTRNDRKQATSLKLSLQSRIDLTHLLQPSFSLLLNTVADLLVLDYLLSFDLSPPANAEAVVCFVPLSEWSSIYLNDCGSGEGICSDKFVVGGMEDDDDDAGFASDALTAPGEVAGI